MFIDASLPPNAPIINGLDIQPLIHGEEDASISAETPSSPTPTLEGVCQDVHRRVSAFLNRPPDSDSVRRVQEQTRISIGVLEKALNDYDFSSLSLSYNGGKDCLVLLILYLSTLYTHFKSSSAADAHTGKPPFPTSIQSIYAESPDPFPAITNFVTSSSKRYHLDLCTIRTNPRPGHQYPKPQSPSAKPPITPQSPTTTTNSNSIPNHQAPSPPQQPLPATRITFRDAFAIYLSRPPNPPPHHNILAIFVGTRRTDPHGAHLTHFDRTDHGWPDFMRIHPVIDWRLSDIWSFLRADELKEPDGSRLAYCDMYDQGYTSLGGVGDTVRNPRLRYVVGDEGGEKYRPAYELVEDEEERLGRK